MKIILHHLGLGDHIVCNGLIRNYLKNKEKHLLVVKNRNIESVKFMFSDLNNLNYLQVDDNVNVRQFINNTFSTDIIKIGFQENERLTNLGYTWDEAFYLQLNVDFNKRWDDFYIPRKINEEKRLFNKLVKKGPYVLIHNSGSDQIDRIDYTKVDPTLNKVFVVKSHTIFDYCTIIEQAAEIHCIDSAFKHLVDSLDTKAKLFYHKNYNYRDSLEHKSKLDWTIV